MKKGDRIVLKKDPDKKGTIQQILPSPYLPSWISPPNYLVIWDDGVYSDVLSRKEIAKC